MNFYPIFLIKITRIRGQSWDFGTLLKTIYERVSLLKKKR